MACDICLRDVHTKDLDFLCSIDARNRLYPHRLALAERLLDNDSLKAQITTTDNDVSPSVSGSPASGLASLEARRNTLDETTARVVETASKLRTEVAAARAEIRERRQELERRRERLGEVRDGVVERRAEDREEVDKATRMRRLKWAQAAEETARYRVFLCHEAARLYGVKKGKAGGSSAGPGGTKYVYYLARLPVVELANMHALTPEAISTSLAHICHILIIASYYLAVRLPAEVILPHRDHSRPAIYNLASSYQPRPSVKARNASRSASSTSLSTPGQVSPSSAHGGRSDAMSRPRPLFVDKPLAQLAKEDAAGYSFFLEGVTLLAYNVAWLCCSQGISVGEKGSFEDVCQMGRNLYNLLIARHALPTPSPTTTTPPEGVDAQSKLQQNQQQLQGEKTNALGRYSHGSTYYSLASADGTELVRNFKLPSPMKLADKLKRKLMGDAPDWEVVDDDAWKMDGDEGEGNGTAVGQAQQQDGGKRGSPKTEYGGWLRVKSR